MTGNNDSQQDPAAGIVHQYPFSKAYKTLVTSVGVGGALVGIGVAVYLALRDFDPHKDNQDRHWHFAVFLFVNAVIWIRSAWVARSRWSVVISHERIQVHKPKDGEGRAKNEMLLSDITGIKRPVSPMLVELRATDGRKLYVPRIRMSKADWADFIVQLREVMKDRFVIPEDW